ncbi:MAG: Type III restriction-modification enzyme helicase subunit [Rhodanobacteraceae bacterium]|jgi:type III restriction enzyme|nr:MAG: Type III restriction-modification enzyme helicase subunit [Rhodanobacteraceae bacterium]
MATYLPKEYQRSVLDSVQKYFRTVQSIGNADSAFYNATLELWNRGIAYHPIDGFDTAMPYFCLRVPTGGGKTWLAAKSVALVNAELLRTEFSVILWLVPSNTIREQTSRALRDREHPYHAALRESGPITVLSLDEAKSVTRATLESTTTVIVSTVQAFRRENTEGLKVFESNGALMSHFEHLDHVQTAELQRDENGAVVCSLANVLRLRRPFLIVDEAHNSRTPLSFATFAQFRPSGIMELTATPDTESTPSNVLHSVSAAELKTENMIKLPIRLETEGDWQECLADAIDCRGQLQAAAETERRHGAAYLRPIVLIQAEPRRKDIETRDVDAVKRALVENHNIPEDEIVIATGETRGLEAIEKEYAAGVADERCPVKYVITQQALAEGWDCPSAYVLVSMAELRSSTAVEQLLGRILRQPQAQARTSALLNQSYAFVVSRDFGQTASALRDRLVDGAGFERREVGDFVAARKDEQARLDLSARPGKVVVTPVSVELPEAPDLRDLPKPVRDKLEWDRKASTLTITVPLTDDETATVQASVTQPEAKKAIEAAAERCRASVEMFQTPAERGEILSVPQMALRVQGELQLFDDPEALDYPWELSPYDADPTKPQIEALDGNRIGEGGEIDVDSESGRVTTRFIAELQRDLGLSYRPEHWDETRLATWLTRNLPETAIPHASKRAFVARWLRALLDAEGFDLARGNRQKFLIRTLLESRVRELRQAAVSEAYQSALFGVDAASRVAVGDDYIFTFNPQGYAPSRDYDGRFGVFDFRKHYYGRIGDFDSKEEFECACKLDAWGQAGRMQFWVRNLVRKEGCSFFLQKADGRFYPDFLCKLNDGSVLAVEYKGSQGWTDAQEDRDIGGLWDALSGGRCKFVMVRRRQWETVEALL